MKKVKVISQVPLLNKQFIRKVRATKKKELEIKMEAILNKKQPFSWKAFSRQIDLSQARLKQVLSEIKITRE